MNRRAHAASLCRRRSLGSSHEEASPAVVKESVIPGAPGSGRGRSPVAVAVEHDRSSQSAPRVTAKGRGALAEQILQIAFDRGVKVRNDADLAEILAAIELDSEIPLETFAAVAEILSYVYRAQARLDTEPSG